MTLSRMKQLGAAIVFLGAAVLPAQAQQFPFDQEMLFETKPLPGSRRVPMMEVLSGGKASIDLWCHSATADVAVSGSEIRFNFTSAKPENCTPERIELDQKMAKALMEVTQWRRENDIVVLASPSSTFRFRLSTH